MKFKLIYGNHVQDGLAILDTLNLLKHGLEDLGHQAHLEHNMCPGETNILIEYFTFDFLEHYRKALETPGTRFIIIATEYLTDSTFNNFDGLSENSPFELLDSHYGNLSYWAKRYRTFSQACQGASAVWHLSEHQIQPYRQMFTQCPVGYLPHAYIPSQEGPTAYRPEERDIDILFTGTITPYRLDLLRQLDHRGLKIKVLPVMTPDHIRESWVRRSRLAVNIRQNAEWRYPSNSRYYYHIMKGPYLVSEKCAESCDLSPYVHEELPESFVDFCEALIRQEQYESLFQEARQRFRESRPMSSYLEDLLGEIF